MRNKLNYMILSASGCLLFFLSCSKAWPDTQSDIRPSAQLEVSAQTRASASSNEQTIGSIQALAFSSDGLLEDFGRSWSSAESITLSCRTGKTTVFVAANAPDLSLVPDMTGLLSEQILLEDNSLTGGFVMSGKTEFDISKTASAVTIPVSRLVAKIVLAGINNHLPEIYGKVNIESVMLTNVVGNCNLSADATPEVWYNRAGRSSSAPGEIIDGKDFPADCPDLTYRSINSSLMSGHSYIGTLPLYCFPNPTVIDSSSGDEFTPRKTRIVLTVTINGKHYYYPATIDNPMQNTVYTIIMTISGLGSDDPEGPISKGSLNFSIGVSPWTDDGSYEDTI